MEGSIFAAARKRDQGEMFSLRRDVRLPQPTPEELLAQPPVEITDIAEPAFASAGDAFHALRRAYAGIEVQNERSGLTMGVSGESLRHSIFHRYTPQSGRAHRALPDLLRRAVLVESRLGRLPRDAENLIGVYRFYAPVRMDGDLYRARLTVRHFRDPSRGAGHYQLEIETEKAPSRVTGARGPKTPRQPPLGEDASTINIGALLAGVKREDGTDVLPGEMFSLSREGEAIRPDLDLDKP